MTASVAGPWGRCRSAACGQPGWQVRRVHCERSGQPTDDVHCLSLHHTRPPPVVSRCVRPCQHPQQGNSQTTGMEQLSSGSDLPFENPNRDGLEQPSRGSDLLFENPNRDGLEQPSRGSDLPFENHNRDGLERISDNPAVEYGWDPPSEKSVRRGSELPFEKSTKAGLEHHSKDSVLGNGVDPPLVSPIKNGLEQPSKNSVRNGLQQRSSENHFGDSLEHPPAGPPVGETSELHGRVDDSQLHSNLKGPQRQERRKVEPFQQHQANMIPQHTGAEQRHREGNFQHIVKSHKQQVRRKRTTRKRRDVGNLKQQQDSKNNAWQYGNMDKRAAVGLGTDNSDHSEYSDHSENKDASDHTKRKKSNQQNINVNNNRQLAEGNSPGQVDRHHSEKKAAEEESNSQGQTLSENVPHNDESKHSPVVKRSERSRQRRGLEKSRQNELSHPQQNSDAENSKENIASKSPMEENAEPEDTRNNIRPRNPKQDGRSENTKRISERAEQNTNSEHSKRNIVADKSRGKGESDNSGENSGPQHSKENGGRDNFGERDEGEADPSFLLHVQRATGREVTARDVEWVVSPWSACRQQAGATSCGRHSGIRHRQVNCERRKQHQSVDTYLCASVELKPPSSEPCELQCQQDCVVTLFSDWSKCDATCQLTNQTRTRRIVVPPRHRGEHCPAFSEMTPCTNCSHTFTYRLGEWGPCKMRGDLPNGFTSHLVGHQAQEITCLSSTGIVIPLRKCQKLWPEAGLVTHRSCVLAQDCIVSPWSPLQPHTAGCVRDDGTVTSGVMTRTRRVLQLPRGEGRECPQDLREEVPLGRKEEDNLRRCDRAQWVTSDWGQCVGVSASTCDGSECVRQSDHGRCGIGLRNRRIICVIVTPDAGEAGGRPTEDDACKDLPKPAGWQSCQRSCEEDCVVTPWSPWSSCLVHDCSDISSLRHRRREKEERQLDGEKREVSYSAVSHHQ
ncbi:hypothetical protein ACOMHN_063750 [Nucella lapillus]